MPRLRILYPNHQMNRPSSERHQVYLNDRVALKIGCKPIDHWFFNIFLERGSWGIRTPGTGTRTAVQQTAGFSHSPKLPRFPLKVSEKHSRSNAGAKVRNNSDSHKFFCNNFRFSFNNRFSTALSLNINRCLPLFVPLPLFTFLPFYFFTFLPFYLFTFSLFYLFTFLPFHAMQLVTPSAVAIADRILIAV